MLLVLVAIDIGMNYVFDGNIYKTNPKILLFVFKLYCISISLLPINSLADPVQWTFSEIAHHLLTIHWPPYNLNKKSIKNIQIVSIIIMRYIHEQKTHYAMRATIYTNHCIAYSERHYIFLVFNPKK